MLRFEPCAEGRMVYFRARREKAVVVRTKDLNDMQRREDIKNFMRTRQQFEEEYKKGGGGHH
eukprot:867691-Amorphochlora_amoeboformis.AAC.2